jgi:hypothetical protein
VSLYTRFVLLLLRPVLDAYHEEKVNAREKAKVVSITDDIRRRVKSGELHL